MNCKTQCRNGLARQNCCTRDYLPPFYCMDENVVEKYNGRPDDIVRRPTPTPTPREKLWDLQQGCKLWPSKYSFYKDMGYETDCETQDIDNDCGAKDNFKWCYNHGGKCLKNLYQDESECCNQCEDLGYNCDPCHIIPTPYDTCEATSGEIGYCLAKGFGFNTNNFEDRTECVPCPDEYDQWTHEDHLVPHNCIKQECSKEAGQFLNLM